MTRRKATPLSDAEYTKRVEKRRKSIEKAWNARSTSWDRTCATFEAAIAKADREFRK